VKNDLLLHHERQSTTISRDWVGPVCIQRERGFRPPRSIHKHMQAVQGGYIAGEGGALQYRIGWRDASLDE
jgi:hypothetical protein